MQYRKITPTLRKEAIQALLTGMSRDKVARQYSVHPVTVWRWLKKYQRSGMESLSEKRPYKRPWNKIARGIEKEVVTIKEKNPAITISSARAFLNRKGIALSRKGIWNIWRRYGLTGFVKEKMGMVTDSRKYFFVDKETTEQLQKTRTMLDMKKMKQAIRILNSLPVCSNNEVLTLVPKSQLSPQRQVDLLLAQSGKIPLREYQTMARTLRAVLRRKKMNYSALRVGIEEGAALTFLEEPRKLLRLTAAMKMKTEGLRDPWLRYTIFLLEGYGTASLLQVQDALASASKCKTIIRRMQNPYFLMGELTSLYYKLGKFREAIYWAQKALDGTSGEYRKDLYSALIGYLTVSGDYEAIPKIAKQEELDKWGYHIRILLCRALYCLNQGEFQEAGVLAEQALLTAEKQEIKAFFFLAILVLACSRAARGERKQALVLLKKYNPLAKRYRLGREYFLQRVLMQDVDLPSQAMSLPDIRLAYLVYRAHSTGHVKDYNRARRYARSQRLTGIFERIILFYPELVMTVLKKGKDTGLLPRFLEMPVFQTEPQSFKIRFLGTPYLYKGERRLHRAHLRPKELSFLIHLAFNKERHRLLQDVYNDFWPTSTNPSRNLSHLLVRLRKVLGIVTRSIRIHDRSMHWNFYCYTDYDDFKETLAQAKALDRVGEWRYAQHEYLRAFSLIKGKPFEKMYDSWSERTRQVVLNRLESEALDYAKHCLNHNNKRDAARVLTKISKVIPYSEEIATALGACR